MSLLKYAIVKGVLSARPTDNTVLTEGRLFFATDTHQVFYDNGATWDDVTPTSTLGSGTYFEDLLTFAGSAATLAHVPATFEGLYEDGRKLRKVGGSPEFSVSGTTITLNYAPLAGGKYVASYWY